MHPLKFSLVFVVLAIAYRPTLAAEAPPHSPDLVPVKPVQQSPLQQTTYQQLTGGWNGNAAPAGRYEPTTGAIPSTSMAPANPATGRGSGLGNAVNHAARETGNELERAYDRTFSTSSPGPLKTVQQVTADFIGDTSKQLRSAGAAITKTTERLVNPPPHPPQTPQATVARQPLAASPATTVGQFAAPPLNTQPTLSTSGLGDAGFNPFANRRPATNSQMTAKEWNIGSRGTGGTAFTANGQPSNIHQAGELRTVSTPLLAVSSPAPQLAPAGLVNVTPVDRQNEMVAGSNSFTNGSRWPSTADREYPNGEATNNLLPNSPTVSHWPNQPGQPQPGTSTVEQTPSAPTFNNAPPLVGFNNVSRNFGNGQPTLTPIPNPGQYRDTPRFQPAGLNPTGPPTLPPQQNWIPLVMTGIGLMGSLGANLFLGFSYLDVRYKYLSAIRRGTRSLGQAEKSHG
jgi:hypothetical protein